MTYTATFEYGKWFWHSIYLGPHSNACFLVLEIHNAQFSKQAKLQLLMWLSKCGVPKSSSSNNIDDAIEKYGASDGNQYNNSHRG